MDAPNTSPHIPRAGRVHLHWGIALALAAVLVPLAAVVLFPGLEIATERVTTARLGDRLLRVWVADTPLRRTWGLQGRLSLSDGDAMVFEFAEPKQVTFVRATVPFPIDVVFVDAHGRVTGIGPLDSTHERVSSPGAVGWVVEVPGGWTKRSGVAVGSPFDPPR
jgi:uncharacterized membrane protein (UPF0127 family)